MIPAAAITRTPRLNMFKARYPGVIIEVSYSQKRKDLPSLADDYILGPDSDICAVVGVDVGYKDKAATLSVWRPEIQVNDAARTNVLGIPQCRRCLE
jgi:hypothetical protein